MAKRDDDPNAQRALDDLREEMTAAAAKIVKDDLASGGDLGTLDGRLHQLLREMEERIVREAAKRNASPPAERTGRTAAKRSRGRASPSRQARFTKRQGQYLAFIHGYTTLHRRAPAQADIQRHFKVTPPSVHQMVLTLERRGLLRRIPGQARSLEVLVPPEELPALD